MRRKKQIKNRALQSSDQTRKDEKEKKCLRGMAVACVIFRETERVSLTA